MFNIPTYFETLFNLSKRNDWTTPKNLSESLTLLLFQTLKPMNIADFTTNSTMIKTRVS